MPHKTSEDHAVTLLRWLVSQIEPEVRQIADVSTRILNLLRQPSLTMRCCAEILAYYTFPARDKSFDVLRSALLSSWLKDAEIKKLISKLPDDKRHLFEPLLGVRAFNFFELSSMDIIPFDMFFSTIKQHSDIWPLPLDLTKLYHRIPESERTSENQQKLWDVVAKIFLIKNVRFSESSHDDSKSLLHLLQSLSEWKPKK